MESFFVLGRVRSIPLLKFPRALGADVPPGIRNALA
jgi:hypothetical protein